VANCLSNTAATLLGNTSVGDGGLWLVLCLSAGAAGGLDELDNLHGLLVGNLAKDDVLAIEPRGDDGGNEELGAVAEFTC
jgi:hypothetical protein